MSHFSNLPLGLLMGLSVYGSQCNLCSFERRWFKAPQGNFHRREQEELLWVPQPPRSVFSSTECPTYLDISQLTGNFMAEYSLCVNNSPPLLFSCDGQQGELLISTSPIRQVKLWTHPEGKKGYLQSLFSLQMTLQRRCRFRSKESALIIIIIIGPTVFYWVWNTEYAVHSHFRLLNINYSLHVAPGSSIWSTE